MRGYEIRSEIQQTQRGPADQRNETEVKGLNNNREMKLKYGDEKPSWDELLPTSEITKTLWNQWDQIMLQNQVLYRRTIPKHEHDPVVTQVILPRNLRREAMSLAHEGMTGGHLGFEKTKNQVQRRNGGLIGQAFQRTCHTSVRLAHPVLSIGEDLHQSKDYWNRWLLAT
jgi:hypothetical protein